MPPAPLTIKFGSDTSAAKAGMADLAGAVVSNVVRMGASMNTAIQANGGYQASVSKLAGAVGKDFLSVSNATLKAANDSKFSAVAIGTAFGKAASETQTAAIAMTGATAVAKANVALGFGLIRKEATETLKAIALSSTAITLLAVAGSAYAAFSLVTAAVSQANNELDRLIKLGKNAEAANVGAAFFQQFSDAAKDARLETDQVAEALKKARDAVKQRPGGETNEVLTKISDYLETNYTKMKDGEAESPNLFRRANTDEERIRAAIAAMRELEEAGHRVEAIDLANTVFGPEIARNIENGKLSLEQLKNDMDDIDTKNLNLDEQVASAEEYKKQLNDAYTAIDNALHVSVALAGAGQSVLDVWLKIAQAVADASVKAGAFLDKMAAAVAKAIEAKNVGQDTQARVQSPLATRPVGPNDSLGASLGADAGARAKRKQEGLDGRTIYDSPVGPEVLMSTVGTPPAPPTRPLNLIKEDAAPVANASPKKAGKEAAESKDQLESFIDQLNKSAEAIKAETDAFNLNNAEKATSINLAKAKATADAAGLTLTDDQIAKIKQLSVAISDARDKLKELELQQRRNTENWNYFGDAASGALGDLIFEGGKLNDVMNQLFKSMGKDALKGLITGQGAFGNLFGTAPSAANSGSAGGLAGIFQSIFSGGGSSVGTASANNPAAGAQGPSLPTSGGFLSSIGTGIASLFRAGGGDVQRGGAYTVGEMGPETFFPDTNGRIIPNARGGSGMMGARIDASSSVSVYAPGAQLGAADQIGAEFDRRMTEERRANARNAASSVQRADRRYNN